MKVYQKNKNRRLYSKAISAVIVCVILLACSLGAAVYVEKIMEDHCFQVLNETVRQGSSDIRGSLENEENQIQIIADLLADHTVLNQETGRKYLNSLQKGSIVSSWAILLPDGQLVRSDKDEADLSGLSCDFRRDSSRPLTLSDAFDSGDGKKYIAYSCPIASGGTIKGVLYGCIDLENLPGMLKIEVFSGQSQMYLLDGDTGDFLMDTWHDSLGNLYTDENFSSRKIKQGSSIAEIKRDLMTGKSGYIVFESKTTGDDFYTCYYPVGLHNLSFQITVPRAAAFKDAIRVQRFINFICVIQFIVSALYAAASFYSSHRENRRNRKELHLNQTLTEIQRILFGVYDNPRQIEQALKIISQACRAEQILFIPIDWQSEAREIREIYCWPDMPLKAGISYEDIEEAGLLEIYNDLLDGNSLLLEGDEKGTLESTENLFGLQKLTIRNMAVVPLLDSEKRVVGSLNVINAPSLSESLEMLEAAAGSFLMALQLINSYKMITRMGTVDFLTELKNRNAYQETMRALEQDTDHEFCCIYIDANGLHEMNNDYGHTSGDKMLYSIASSIREKFGKEHAYRIGGDEFVVICDNLDEDSVREKINALKQDLARMSYDISTGYAFRKKGQAVLHVIETAEQAMYHDKELYYSEEKDRRSRRLPH